MKLEQSRYVLGGEGLICLTDEPVRLEFVRGCQIVLGGTDSEHVGTGAQVGRIPADVETSQFHAGPTRTDLLEVGLGIREPQLQCFLREFPMELNGRAQL
ncbi:hypothetical protein [Amycolatopsis sp. cmx-8-4]|uniref:hypothetical protein n=1 Tax=Amycolatopsis sp. cmx-8-4 TaxID=2790947 RepID=UPI00397E581E